ncbi:GxxExxY protein [Deltaproteobacteria bacterium TL4]
MGDILYPTESYAIIGACFEVYKDKGPGFLEAVYQECLEIEFDFQNIPYLSQKEIQLFYRGNVLKQTYKPDFICYKNIIVEIKALTNLSQDHQAQVLNYLHATNTQLGLLINFGHYPQLEYKRMALTNNKKR